MACSSILRRSVPPCWQGRARVNAPNLSATPMFVIPAKAGIQRLLNSKALDSSFRWNDVDGVLGDERPQVRSIGGLGRCERSERRDANVAATHVSHDVFPSTVSSALKPKQPHPEDSCRRLPCWRYVRGSQASTSPATGGSPPLLRRGRTGFRDDRDMPLSQCHAGSKR